MKYFKIKRISLVILSVHFFGSLFNGSSVVFAGGAAGFGTASGTGSSSGGKCNGSATHYMVDCTGMSWIFYKATGSASGDIVLPYTKNGPKVVDKSGGYAYIPKACSEHRDKNSGFWAYGYNGRSIGYYDSKGFAGGERGDLTTLSKDGNLTINLFFGHWAPATWPSYSDSYKTDIKNGTPKQKIGVYQFDHAGTVDTVLKAYNTYLASEGKSQVTSLPSGLYGFCYWDGMGQGKLTGFAVDESGRDLDPDPGSATAESGKKATITAKAIKNHIFLGWRTNKSSGTPSGSASYSRTMSSGGNITVYAVYKFKPLPCGGTCGSTLKLELNHDGKTEASTAIVSGIDDVSKKITKTPFMEEFEAGTSKYYGKVYVKPGEVSIKGSFKPEYQSYREEKPEKFSIIDYAVFGSSSEAYRAKSGDDYYSEGWNNNNNLNITSDDITIEQYVKNFYNKSFFSPKYDTNSKGKQWNNAFNIAVKDNAKTEVDCHLVQGTIGDNSEFHNTISYSFKVGHRFSMQSRTNDFRNDNETSYCVNDDHITPRVIKFDYDSEYNERATIDNSRTRTARIEAYVPYNFVNSASIKNNNSDEVVFAGETINKIEYTVTSYTRHNSKVNPENSNDKYLTNVPDAKVRFRYRYNGSNEYINIGSEESIGSIGASSDVGISTADITKDGRKNISIPVPDFSAGDRICISLSVWPRDSLSDTTWEWNDIENNVGWSDWSNEKCYIIAKKPSFQIWGGSLYSNGNISLPTATKKIKNEDITRTFGSWVELGLTSEGKVEGLASGAGTAGGINIRSFCNISTLSIPNNNCANYVGRASSGDRVENRSNLVEMYDGGIDENNIDIGPETISGGTPIVTKTKGTVTIKDNIEYENKNYATLQEIPKRIIYAKNININCEVTRIDAVLIAEEDINTCADGGDDNDQKRSTQLIINGSTISDKLILGRTYGAATGVNSATPAEIINYDASLYLWARKNDASRGSSKFINVSTSELAPRY